MFSLTILYISVIWNTCVTVLHGKLNVQKNVKKTNKQKLPIREIQSQILEYS